MMMLDMTTRTAGRTMCHDWAFKSSKVQPGFKFSQDSSSALRECKSVGMSHVIHLGPP